MGDETAISWADKTFNIWIGCEHAPAGPGSEGTAPECDNCYAEAWDGRNLHGEGSHWGPGSPRRFLSDAYWRKPLAWNRDAKERGIRFRVFCSSLADWAERHPDPQIARRQDGERARLWELIRETPHLDWLLLTKRPGNLATMLPWCSSHGFNSEPWPNVWLGVTAGAVRSLWRVAMLRTTPAARRFVSCEPILEGITAAQWDHVLGPAPACFDGPDAGPIDWLIIGDESGQGPDIREADPAWVATAIDAAERHGAIPHFKQWAGAGHPDIAGSLDADRKRRKIHLPVFRGRKFDGVPH
jgi:protein gp37